MLLKPAHPRRDLNVPLKSGGHSVLGNALDRGPEGCVDP